MESRLMFLALICALFMHCGATMALNSSTAAPIINSSSSSPSNSPSTVPSESSSLHPSTNPSESPSRSPSSTLPPTAAPTTVSPTAAPATTIIGPSIHSTQQLEVNFTLNFSSTSSTTPRSVNDSLNFAYGWVGIPVNYVHNVIHLEAAESYYVCRVFSSIDAKDKSDAVVYQKQIGSDPDESSSQFVMYLKQTLSADSQRFDISIPIMDIVPAETDHSSTSDDTASIIIWFLGVSAVCAVGALCLIICWRKFSAKDENEIEKENENAINLEFLLDPNATMHIDEVAAVDTEKSKPHKQYFNRLDDAQPQPIQMQQNKAEPDEEETAAEAEEEEEEAQEADYQPPNLDRI